MLDRRSWCRGGLALGLSLAGLTFLPAEDPAPPATAWPSTLRVLAWNIHHGEGLDKRLDLPRLAEVIKQADPDIVLLQEVDDRAQRTQQVAQVEELAKLTGLHGTFGKAMDFEGGGYGNAILTRQAPAATRVIPLPGGGEPRCALEVTLKFGDRELFAVSTHLDVSSPESRAQHAQKLAAEYAAKPSLVILGGDFNDRPGTPTLQAFTAPWVVEKKQGDPATIPADAPRREIDFILLKPAAPPAEGAPTETWTVSRYEVVKEAVASDHRPVLLEIKRVAP